MCGRSVTRQESWFSGMESAFTAFGGTTEEVLFDNARALVGLCQRVGGVGMDDPAQRRLAIGNETLIAWLSR